MVTTCEPTAEPVAWDLPVEHVLGVWDGRLLVSLRRSCDVGSYDPRSGELTRLSNIPLCLSRSAFLRQGVVFDVGLLSRGDDAQAGDSELVSIDLHTGTLSVLTANGLDETAPIISLHGARLLSSQHIETLYDNVPFQVVTSLEL